MQNTAANPIAISGSTGLVGTAVASKLTAAGQPLLRLVRRDPRDNTEVLCDASTNNFDSQRLEGLQAVVHLAGENIAHGRWTTAKKSRIRSSRVDFTASLCRQLASLERPPRCLIAASAIGVYGSRGDLLLDESSSLGDGFLADVCRDWEAACQPAQEAGIRVVQLRIGVVLSTQGGALRKLLTPFRLGLGGVVGNGDQFMSWITLDDLAGAIEHCLTAENLAGPVNGVAPHPVTNREFTKTLGRLLRRPTLLPLPGFAARLAMGEMAEELLLSSTRVIPTRLVNSGFQFQTGQLEAALRQVLGMPNSSPR